MTEKETKSFQIKTIVFAAVVTGIMQIGFASFDYNRSDSKEVKIELDKKVDKDVYEKDKADNVLKDSKQAEFNMETKSVLTEIKTNTTWLVEEYKRRNK